MPEKNWNSLDHQIYRDLKALDLAPVVHLSEQVFTRPLVDPSVRFSTQLAANQSEPSEQSAKKKFLLMISGGADSVFMLHTCLKLQSALQWEFEILHCHHGPSANREQMIYRDRAQEFVEILARKKNVICHIARSENELHSEEALRDFRKSAAEKVNKQRALEGVFWAQHQDDFLETQIMRLIRGVGPEKFQEPMTLQKENHIRPLLKISRQQIVETLQNEQQEWIEDPSNQDEKYLRNWIRKSWLPQLEEKCPGALKSFSRSLGLIQSFQEASLPEDIWLDMSLSRPIFMTLSEAQKNQVLALYLRKVGQKEFTHNQIKEIRKHLDNPQLNHTFKTAQLEWHLSKDLIYARPRSVVNAF